MNFLNAQQLAFLLEIKKEDARKRMCVAYAKSLGETNRATMDYKRDKKGKAKPESKMVLVDPYPLAMSVETLATHLPIPNLQTMVDDVVNNFLTRAATKKWILCDYVEKAKAKDDFNPDKTIIRIPPGLRSMLPVPVQKEIVAEWEKRYPKTFFDV